MPAGSVASASPSPSAPSPGPSEPFQPPAEARPAGRAVPDALRSADPPLAPTAPEPRAASGTVPGAAAAPPPTDTRLAILEEEAARAALRRRLAPPPSSGFDLGAATPPPGGERDPASERRTLSDELIVEHLARETYRTTGFSYEADAAEEARADALALIRSATPAERRALLEEAIADDGPRPMILYESGPRERATPSR
jgi:hypothetical protein